VASLDWLEMCFFATWICFLFLICSNPCMLMISKGHVELTLFSISMRVRNVSSCLFSG
jgi:hypothetical protein